MSGKETLRWAPMRDNLAGENSRGHMGLPSYSFPVGACLRNLSLLSQFLLVAKPTDLYIRSSIGFKLFIYNWRQGTLMVMLGWFGDWWTDLKQQSHMLGWFGAPKQVIQHQFSYPGPPVLVSDV
ncbi:Hypothetical predicted protein [Prunus dulcis]|uniref:Uncharacterized protein n=1 Tax=Prunus dulcis TaxID=3755 RepID=A0A5E4F8E5_PRUDU|nr:Hypothetical predicted protein [Prunus dulcis]